MSKLYNSINILGNTLINKIPSRHFRRSFYRMLGAHIGSSYLFRRVETLDPNKLTIGDNCSIGWFTLLDARGEIEIENNVNISSYVKLITAGHDINSMDFHGTFGKIKIKNNAVIFTGATILPGITIGTGAVVAAEAVVTKDVMDYEIVAGIPAKKIGERNRTLDYIVTPPPMLY